MPRIDFVALAADAARACGYVVERAEVKVRIDPNGVRRFVNGRFFGVADLLCMKLHNASHDWPPVLLVAVSGPNLRSRKSARISLRHLATVLHGSAGVGLELWDFNPEKLLFECFDRIGSLVRLLRIARSSLANETEPKVYYKRPGWRKWDAASPMPRRD